MRKLSLFKALLVAVCLLGGSNFAWGAKTVVGNLDNSTGWWTAFSDYYTITPNSSLTLTFTNYSKKESSYQNYLAVLTNDADRGADGYSEYYVLRADGNKWGTYAAGGTYTCSEGIGMPSDNSAEMNGNETLINILDGANVILKITRSGATVTLRADFTTTTGAEYFQQMVITADDGTQNIRLFLTTEKGHIENLCEGAWNNVQTLDFENADTYQSGWSIVAGGNTRSQIDHKSGKAMQVEADSNGSRDYYYNFATNDGFTSAPIWKIELDFAGSTANTDQTRFYIYSAASGASYGQFTNITKFFDITDGASYTTTAKVYAGNDTETSLANLTYSSYKTAISTWYHITLIGNSVDNSVKLSIRDASDAIVLTETKVCDFVNAKGMSIRAGKGLGKIAIDDVRAYKYVNPTVTTKYQLSDGTSLMDDKEEEVISGNSYSPSYPNSFKSGTKQYTYVSGGGQIASVTADQTVTIVYSENDLPEGYIYAETYEKSGGTTEWTTSVRGRYTPVILTNGTNKYLSINQSQTDNNGCSVTGTQISGKAEANTDFTLIFDLQLACGNNQASNFTIYDAAGTSPLLKLQGTVGSTSWIVNNDDNLAVTLASGTWYTMQFSRSNNISYLTVIKTNDSSEILARTEIAKLSDNGGIGNVVFATGRKYANFAMDNVIIREIAEGDVPAVTATTYTIKYQDALGTQLADDIVTATVVGQVVEASAAQTEPIYYNETKYCYTSGNDPITIVADAASNVITLIYHEAATWSYTVKAIPTNETIATGSALELDAVRVPYPHYSLSGTTLYMRGSNSNEYRYSFTQDEDNKVVELSYNANMDNCLYYSEGEDIEGTIRNTTGTNVPIRASKAAAASIPTEVTIYSNLPAGAYKLLVGVHHTSNNASVTTTFAVGEKEISVPTQGTNLQENKAVSFIITEPGDFVCKGITGNGLLDYIGIIKTSETVNFTLGAEAGDSYKSFVTSTATDFTATGVSAYVAKAADKTNGVVTLSMIDNAPANTPVLLKGTKGGSVEIAPTSEVVSAPENNLLVAANGSTAISGTEAKYVLAYTNGNWEFRHFNGTLSAGKVYLDLTGLAGAREDSFSFVFDDDNSVVTGISEMRNEKSGMRDGNDVVYDLQGRRVAQPKKGLFIQNGKKVAY